jgi:hypothetical protein
MEEEMAERFERDADKIKDAVEGYIVDSILQRYR